MSLLGQLRQAGVSLADAQDDLIRESHNASLCARASSVGLLPEQLDPATGEFFGNFPQAFSHIGVIAAGVTLARTINDLRAAGTMRASP
jgi:Glycosyl hydrolases family 15